MPKLESVLAQPQSGFSLSPLFKRLRTSSLHCSCSRGSWFSRWSPVSESARVSVVGSWVLGSGDAKSYVRVMEDGSLLLKKWPKDAICPRELGRDTSFDEIDWSTRLDATGRVDPYRGGLKRLYLSDPPRGVVFRG